MVIYLEFLVNYLALLFHYSVMIIRTDYNIIYIEIKAQPQLFLKNVNLIYK